MLTRSGLYLGRRAVALCGAIVLLLMINESSLLSSALEPLSSLTARVTYSTLNAFGMAAVREGTVLRHASGFAYEIYHWCTGILPGTLLVAMVMTVPMAASIRMAGAILGVALVLAVNLVRLVSLFYIGVHYTPFFDLAHVYVWQALMLGFVAFFCFSLEKRTLCRVASASKSLCGEARTPSSVAPSL